MLFGHTTLSASSDRHKYSTSLLQRGNSGHMGTKMTPIPQYGDFHCFDSRMMWLNNNRRYSVSPLYRHSPMVVQSKYGLCSREMTLHGGTPNTPRFYGSPSSSFVPLIHQEETSSESKGNKRSPPSSPAFLKRVSPTRSLRTSPTASTDLHASPDTFHTARRLSYSPVAQSGWVSPPDMTYCQVIDGNYDSPRRGTPLMEGAKTTPRPWSPREEQDPIRRSRIKTELCMHYENNQECPFGSGCTYAHGEEELQLTKLMDLHRAGLVDVQTYRTKPCLTWVSTGSCPFGKRCAALHDPRVAGSLPSWLPHTETQGNTISTDINVDGLHQKRTLSILHDNPFGELFSFDFDDYESLYRLICNTPRQNKRKRSNLTERHKIEIALAMRASADWHYKFRPQHIIYDELCMVLQKRAFLLTDEGATEIPVATFNISQSDHVLVREIAFGPDSDPGVRGVSLWFNIEDKDLTLCTPQQAKRYRWKRGLKNDAGPKTKTPSPSAFESKECFVMVRPHDSDAFRLTTDILAHRLEVLRAGRESNMSARFSALKALDTENRRLQAIFEDYRRYWQSWAWPANRDPGDVDDSTPAPKVDSLYCLSKDTVDGSSVERVWSSFIDFQQKTENAKDIAAESNKRLSVFRTLSEGAPVTSDRFSDLPRLSPSWPYDSHDDSSNSRQSERCWRALLLEDESQYGSNEWDMVRKHFEYSRSKKVLSILQHTP